MPSRRAPGEHGFGWALNPSHFNLVRSAAFAESRAHKHMPVPVVSVEQMRQWEAASWTAGCNPAQVIRQAGAAVGRFAQRLTRPGDHVLILAGRGNNGADARHAEPELAGRAIQIINVLDPATALAEVQAALALRPALVIDGLFGIGLNRPLDAAWIAVIEAINHAALPVLAVDVPSGLMADTGTPAGGAVRAAFTVTFGAPKRGLLAPGAAAFTGRIEVAAQIGLIPCPVQGDLLWTLPGDFAAFPPGRPVDAHKGTFGHLYIVAGSVGYHGAAVLCARGAQRAMPGLISLVTTEAAYGPIATALHPVMVGVWHEEFRPPETAGALVFGPGLAGRDVPGSMQTRMRRAWQSGACPVLADASGLDWVPANDRRTDEFRVITPHPGEAARLLNANADAIQRDRVTALRELSRRFGDCLVVLKGHHTLIGTARGPVFINPTGNPGLAQGGAGDVLAGFAGGLLAQHRHHGDPLLAVRYAAWRHGLAADQLAATREHWTIDDLAAALGTEPRPV